MDDHRSVSLLTDSPDATRRVAGVLADLFRLGDVIALAGDLGAGKTCFVQGAAAALGVTERVTSPTFVLVRHLRGGRLPIVHCDVYRLETLRDVDDLGDEVMGPDNVTFLEWADAVAPLLPDSRLEVELQLVDDGDGEPRREVVLRGTGDWIPRWDAVTTAVADWVR